MRKACIVLLTLVILFVSSGSILALDQPIKIIIDGKLVYSDAPPIISSNRVLVPVRVVSESLGYAVSWHNEEQLVYMSRDNVSIKFKIGLKKIWINGNERTIDVTPIIKNGRSYLPIRVVSESIGADVTWDGGTRSVIVKTGKESVKISSIDNSKVVTNEQNLSFSSLGNNLLDFEIFQLDNPSRLVIDFDQMLLEDLKLPYLQENGIVKEIRSSQFELDPNKVRVVLDLKYRADYTYQIINDSLVLSLTPHIYKVVIDAGHGGKDPGAIGVSGTYEKDLNLAITLKLVELLNDDPSINVALTRASDVYLSLDDRVKYANSVDPDIFISIHHNSIPYKSSINGSETYYTRSVSSRLASTVHKYLLMSTGFTNRGVDTAGFRVIKYTDMPAALIEVGYLSNWSEEQKMLNPYFQDSVARGLESAIKEYFNID